MNRIVATSATSAAAGWLSRSRTTTSRRVPIGMSVAAACSGCPNHLPLRKSLSGRIGRKRAPSQRWLNSPSGVAHPSCAAMSRAIRRPISYLLGECIHRASTVASSSGITFGHFATSSWTSRLWGPGPPPYISSCPKGQIEPPDRFEERSSGRSLEPGSPAARQASEEPGGDQGLRIYS